MAAPAGTNVTLVHGDYRATVVEVGAGLRTLSKGGLDLVAGYAENEMCQRGRGQVLLPWPNRVADGRYEFRGRRQQLPLSEPAHLNAIHGLTRWVSWTLLDATSSSARWGYRLHPQPGYPGELELTVDYRLSDAGLRVETSATNTGVDLAPYGTGAHPYLTVDRPIDGCELLLPAATRCATDGRGLPGTAVPVDGTGFDFRTSRPIGPTQFDHPFGDLGYDEGRAVAVLRDPGSGRTASIWVEPAYRWLQVFSGDDLPDLARQALAVEPMTCPPNAFNSLLDLVVLEPAATHRAVFGIF